MCSGAFLQSTSTSSFARLRVPLRVFFSQHRTTSSAVRVRVSTTTVHLSSDGSSRVASSAPNHNTPRLWFLQCVPEIGGLGRQSMDLATPSSKSCLFVRHDWTSPTSSVSVARSTPVSPSVSRSGLLGDCPVLCCYQQHGWVIVSFGNTSCSLLQHGFCRAPTRLALEVHTQRDTDRLLHASLIRSVSIQAVRPRHRKRQHRCVDMCFFVGERIVLCVLHAETCMFALTCDGFVGYRVPERWWS